MNRYFPQLRTPSNLQSDDVILAPEQLNPLAKDQKEFSEFTYLGKQYIRCQALTKGPKHTKQRESKIWRWGEDIQLRDDTSSKPARYFFCYLCEKQKRKQELLVVGTGRGPAMNHLVEDHNMDRETGAIRLITTGSSSQPTIEEFNELRRLDFARGFEQFKQLLIRWLVCCHIAFFQLENQYFRELLSYLNSKLPSFLPRASNTIRRWVIESFTSKKSLLKAELASSVSRITLSFDLWTSPNGLAILGVVGHFINHDGKRRQVLLGLREVIGEHSGENMAAILLAIIREYDLQSKIGFFMADNAESNDTAIHAVLKVLYPQLTKRQRNRHRLRCFGHIVNLIAQAFIIGKDSEKICREIDVASREMDFKKVHELWKRRGAIGKLHNIVRYIRFSPQRRNFFKRIIIGGEDAEFDRLMV